MSDTNGLSGTLTIPSSISSGLPEVEGSGKALVSVSGEWAEQDGYGYTDENDTVHLMDSKYIPQNANLNALTDLGTSLGVDMTSCTATTDAGVIDFIADNYVAPSGGGGATLYTLVDGKIDAGLTAEDFVGAWLSISGTYLALTCAEDGTGQYAGMTQLITYEKGLTGKAYIYTSSTGEITPAS